MSLFELGRVGVKICGITNEADAQICLRAGADALGFNFYSGSKRFIRIDESLDWIRRLKGTVDRVAVVVNPSSVELAQLWNSGCFEFIQFHGDETPAECAAGWAGSWIRAIRAKDASTLQAALDFSTPNLLLDSWSPSAYGGTGGVADWTLIRNFISSQTARNIILAGGLSPENVAEAIRVVKPDAVDVAGGVESSLRTKDFRLVQDFIFAVRSASICGGNSP